MHRKEDNDMQVLYSRYCGLDVHQKTVVACVMITQANGKVDKSIRTFATTTAALLAEAGLVSQSAGQSCGDGVNGSALAANLQCIGRPI
jgi:hypothetical protein